MSDDAGRTSNEAGRTSDETSRGEEHHGADSELEEGLNHLGRAVGGVLTRLLGSRYTQVDLDPERPVISPEVDEAMDRAGAAVGRWLHAAGEGLARHPTDPAAAVGHASAHKDDDLELREGEAPLAAGVRALASGLARTGAAVLDVVAPRHPDRRQGTAEEGAGDDGHDSGPDRTAAGEADADRVDDGAG